MSQKQLSRSLSELQQALAEGNLNAGQITDGLERIAKALDPSPLTKPDRQTGSSCWISRTPQRKFAESRRSSTKPRRGQSQGNGGTISGCIQCRRERIEATRAAYGNAANGDESAQRHRRHVRRSNKRQKNSSACRPFSTASGFRAEASAQIDALRIPLVEHRAKSVRDRAKERVRDKVKVRDKDRARGKEKARDRGKARVRAKDRVKDKAKVRARAKAKVKGEGEGDQPGRGGGRGGKQAGLSGPFPMRGEPTELEVQFDKEALPVKPTRGIPSGNHRGSQPA